MDKRITVVENPVEQSYEEIQEQYFNKWVAILQPDDLLVFKLGTVVAYADATDDLFFELSDYCKPIYGKGNVSVKRFRDEGDGDCYVIISNVQ